MEINLTLAIIIVCLLFLVLPTIFMVVFFNKKRLLKVLGWIFFVVYIMSILVLVLGKVEIIGKKVFLTFLTQERWFKINFLWADFGKANIFLNLVMLFPVSAFLFSQEYKNVFLKTIIFSFCISLTIEFLQFVLPVNRCTEIFDICLNIFSGIIGYLFFECINIFIIKVIKK